jgi:predicted nucleic acid-binding protein
MLASGLIDTGAILALVNRRDSWHTPCVETFRTLRLPLLTSEAVLTEVFQLVGSNPRDSAAVWQFVLSGAVEIGAIENRELPALRSLMDRYSDRPMDFADATLVYLAKRDRLKDILTVDHNDFETYRIEGRRGFRVRPSRPART